MGKRRCSEILPAWLVPYNIEGNIIKKDNNGHFYLYQRHDGRSVYLGRVTEDGLIPSKKRDISNTSNIINTNFCIYEYGYTRAMQVLCPHNWKKDLGSDADVLLTEIILQKSPDSYLVRSKTRKLSKRRYYIAQYDKLVVLLRQRGISMEELYGTMSPLKLLIDEGKMYLSQISDEQQKLCSRHGISYILEGRSAPL